jgi:hypothetical protein
MYTNWVDAYWDSHIGIGSLEVDAEKKHRQKVKLTN